MPVSWSDGAPTWRANGTFLMYGPMIVAVCLTKTGARFGAWRRNRNGAKP